jgi:hypothetical protein
MGFLLWHHQLLFRLDARKIAHVLPQALSSFCKIQQQTTFHAANSVGKSGIRLGIPYKPSYVTGKDNVL